MRTRYLPIKPITVILLVFFLAACSSDDSNQNDDSNTAQSETDIDGDGVTAGVEQADGTDPLDPCSFKLASQDYTITTEVWKNLDCDGDGVINSWEVDNGTDPLDFCSLDRFYQTVEPSNEWKEFNCDDDCFNNGFELRIGTDPTEANSFSSGSGNIEELIPIDNTFDEFKFNNDGSLFLGYRAGGPFSISSFYDYIDNKVSLITSEETDQGVIYYVSYSYTGEEISSIDQYGALFNVTYANNIISVTESNPPTGAPEFYSKIELDPSTQNVVNCQQYRRDDNNTTYLLHNYNYVYDASGENLLERTVEISDFATSSVIESYTETYEYYPEILNPVSNAAKVLEIPTLTISLNGAHGYSHFTDWGINVSPAMISKNLLKAYYIDGSLTANYLVDVCDGTGEFPIVTYRESTFNGVYFKYW